MSRERVARLVRHSRDDDCASIRFIRDRAEIEQWLKTRLRVLRLRDLEHDAAWWRHEMPDVRDDLGCKQIKPHFDRDRLCRRDDEAHIFVVVRGGSKNFTSYVCFATLRDRRPGRQLQLNPATPTGLVLRS